MTNLSQIPTDYKKMFDTAIHAYLPKANKVRTLYTNEEADSGQVTFEYVRQTQTYADPTGWTSFTDPDLLADGTNAPTDSIGLEDATSTPISRSKAYTIDRKLMNSSLPIQTQEVAKLSVEMVNIIENKINRVLIAGMVSNAGQTYSAASGTWTSGADPVADIVSAKMQFMKQSGGTPADFCLVNNTQYTMLEMDQRFQNTLYTNSKSLDTGTITPKPFGLDFVIDPAVSAGTFFLGKKGMFGKLIISENYKTFETNKGLAGKQIEGVFTCVDQYQLPYYLLYGTGI